MPLFSRKAEMTVTEFCQQFFDASILAVIDGTDVALQMWDVYYDQLVDAEVTFASVPRNHFYQEMTAVRFEVFALAWKQAHGNDKLGLSQLEFTKRYLSAKGRADLWEAMGEYSKTVGMAAKLATSGERATRGNIAFTDTLRLELFKKWSAQGFDKDCAARLANHQLFENAWKKGITPAALALKVAERVNHAELSGEAQFRLEAMIFGLFSGASAAIKEVRVSG